MSIEPKMILNGQDDVARRKFAKKTLSDRVEFTLEEEFGWGPLGPVGHYIADTTKKAIGMDKKKSGKKDAKTEDTPKIVIAPKPSKSPDFNEGDHPRGPDGKFTEAPASNKKAPAVDIKAKTAELDKLAEAQWEADKANWDAAAIKKANEQIDKITKGDLKKAQNELVKIRKSLKEDNLSDTEFEKRSKKFSEANQKVKKAKEKIAAIQPEPFKTPKPGKATFKEPPPPPQKEKNLVGRVLHPPF
jgi:hypothetical protein